MSQLEVEPQDNYHRLAHKNCDLYFIIEQEQEKCIVNHLPSLSAISEALSYMGYNILQSKCLHSQAAFNSLTMDDYSINKH